MNLIFKFPFARAAGVRDVPERLNGPGKSCLNDGQPREWNRHDNNKTSMVTGFFRLAPLLLKMTRNVLAGI
jgi:hypothetical protein